MYLNFFLASSNNLQHFSVSLCSLQKQIRLPYSKWKGTSFANVPHSVRNDVCIFFGDFWPPPFPCLYRGVRNGLQNIVQRDPGRARQINLATGGTNYSLFWTNQPPSSVWTLNVNNPKGLAALLKVGENFHFGTWTEAEFWDGDWMLLLWASNEFAVKIIFWLLIGCSRQQHSISI